jgi:hypothetical protein
LKRPVAQSVPPAAKPVSTIATVTESKQSQKYGTGVPVKITGYVSQSTDSSKGTLTFYDGTRKLGSVKITSGSSGTLTLPKKLKVGKHTFSVKFVASGSATSSASPQIKFTVQKTPVMTTPKAKTVKIHETKQNPVEQFFTGIFNWAGKELSQVNYPYH